MSQIHFIGGEKGGVGKSFYSNRGAIKSSPNWWSSS